MKLVIGSDHGGFEMKERVKRHLLAQGYSTADFGCYSADAVDYPDIALLVAEAVQRREYDRGVLLDGTGGGVTLAANKVPGVRAVCAYNELTGRFASEHDDANVLCLGGKTVGELVLIETVMAWLETPYGGGRHARRLAKIADIERKYSRAPAG